MKSLERLIATLILASRWLLVVFYLGLAAALGVYALSFLLKLWAFMSQLTSLDETGTILKMLSLIDAALVASLVVMVIISGYENFVSQLDGTDAKISWLGQIDTGSLKIKVASTIVAISSIHLLQIFLNADKYSSENLMWFTIMHMAFVASALLLGLLDRIMALTKQGKNAAGKH